MANYSPLRYPGGKAKIYKMIKRILVKNELSNPTYIEPFAGGAGLGLNLLFKGDIDKLILNDYDRSIYAFWYCCLYKTDDLTRLIEITPVDIENWYIQKDIQSRKSEVSLLELGFSTFYLNRTNRSGIIKGGVMGGLNQNGNYKMDCRFNKKDLIKRIWKISEYKDKISIHNIDAIDFIKYHLSDVCVNSLTFFDPPYYNKADGLYSEFYCHDDHVKLRNAIIEYMKTPYIITYDNVDEIINMYNEVKQFKFDISYSASIKRTEKEIMITDNIKI